MSTRASGALSEPMFRHLWLGGIGIFFAVTSQAVARAWVAYQLTGTNAGLGGVMLGFGIAMLLTTPWAGVCADRFDRRRILVICTCVLTLTSLWIGVMLITDAIQYWMLVTASAMQAVAFAFFGPARMAVTTQVVGPTKLDSAIVLSQISLESVRVVGPAVAGVLVGVTWFGAGGVFLVGAVASASGLLAYRRLDLAFVRRADHGSPLREIGDGFRYVGRDPNLSLLIGTTLLVVIVGFPYVSFLPSLSDEVFSAGSRGYGVLSAASAVGAVTVGVVTTRRSTGSLLGRMRVAGPIYGAALMGLAVAPSLIVAVPILAVLGASGLGFQTASQSMMMSMADPGFQGRVQSTLMIGFSGFGIMSLPLGVLADAIGIRETFAAMSVVVLSIVATFAVRSRRLVTGTERSQPH